MKKLSKESIYRILDANLNRAAEGLRVCEEVVRFILDDHRLTTQFRRNRHQLLKVINSPSRENLIKKRDSLHDVGRDLLSGELKRSNYRDIFFANMQRAKESLRVLEEFTKLIDISAAISLKKIRYHVYEIEKKATIKLSALSDIRREFVSSR